MRFLSQFTTLLLLLGLVACNNSNEVNRGSGNAAICADGQDNDNDGFIDFPEDPGCESAADTDETNPAISPVCSDGQDNDNDGLIDHPNDPGCDSAADTDETDPATAPACSDGLDNDGDGDIDHPNDSGCENSADNDEANPPAITACSDGQDNDGDGLIDHPADPGCANAADNDETDLPTPPAPLCSDGVDNDGDGNTDFPDDPGCTSADDNDETDAITSSKVTRYGLNNQCWAIKANGNGNFLVRTNNGYVASAADKTSAEPFFMKPSALGKYLIYNRNRQLLSANGSAVENVDTTDANDDAEWTLIGVGDTTEYPPTPAYNVEPTPEEVLAYMDFVDPNTEFTEFTFTSDVNGSNLAIDSEGNLFPVATGSAPPSESLSFERISGCADFPEAQSNFEGTPFSGTLPNGSVLGHADAHVHISATEFLGNAQWGRPYHKFGVEHALPNCTVAHGPTGTLDVVGSLMAGSFSHATDGYPTFSDWPNRGNLTHEAIYWKWIERAWASGLRVIVNDLVDNETLCELQRTVSLTSGNNPLQDCNSMTNAGEQAGTMYGLMDYIDAQYGGRGEGFFQITHDPAQAREVIADGKIAVVLGIEISNLYDCKLTYNPLRITTPETETGAGISGLDNSYGCTIEEGLPNSVLTQMERIHGWGVRQVISIHEFDNAFGGNGIFDGLILNLGNRENSGGIPSGDLSTITALLSPSLSPDQVTSLVTNLPNTELPTGEFWTTYDCPAEDATEGFSGYLWGNAGGRAQDLNLATLTQACIPTGQGGRAGGVLPCYPNGVRQCNARWMTPIGQYTLEKTMEMGFILDFDHMAVGMKTQLLELTEAQDISYPIVSTHGTFGGITNDQAIRVLQGGGILYPSNGSSRGFRGNMDETFGLYQLAFPGPDKPLFGFPPECT